MPGRNPDRIVIAGAGPVGLTAALMLAQRGIPVTVLESEPELPEDIRAAGFHPPTLDLLDECGATDAVVAMGIVCPVMQYRDRREGKVVEFDLSLLKNDTRHPYRLQCEQFKLCAWLVEALSKIAATEVLFSTRLTNLSQDDDSVDVVVETADGGERRLRATYLIGADGGRSIARKVLDVPFEGKTYPERFITMGTPLDLRRVIPDLCSVNFVTDDRKPFLIFQVPELWRIGYPIPDDVSDEQALDEDNLQQHLQDIAPKPGRYELTYCGIYRVHQRVAANYRVGRVFLAGDAAHLNNPAGGMGMNGGLHDAVSLARRIGRVWHGEAGDAELDGYEAQRRPEAINAINVQTDANFRELVEKDTDVRQNILAKWRRMATDRASAYEHLLQTSMIASLRRSGMIS